MIIKNSQFQALEKRTKESKQEMDILEKLEELRDLNTRQANGMIAVHLSANAVFHIFVFCQSPTC